MKQLNCKANEHNLEENHFLILNLVFFIIINLCIQKFYYGLTLHFIIFQDNFCQIKSLYNQIKKNLLFPSLNSQHLYKGLI